MQRKRRGARFAALLLVIAVFSACTTSKVDPDALIAIGGTLERQDGAPVVGTKVALSREGDLGEAFFTLFSLGLTCLAPELPNICEGARVTQTDADGSYAFELKGSDTQGTGRSASTMHLTSRLERTERQLEGPAVTMRFLVQTETITLPLRFWEPRVEATTDGRSARVRWSRIPGGIAPDGVSLANLTTDVQFARGNQIIWAYRDVRSGEALDLRYLEDASATLAVEARASDRDAPEIVGSTVDLAVRSGRYPVAQGRLVPPSRGRACFVFRDGDPVAQSACGLTDGRFGEPFEPRTAAICDGSETDQSRCSEPHHQRAMLDLGRSQRISLVVVRGCNGACTIETSTDGRRWKLVGAAGSGLDENVAIEAARPRRARYVRVSAQGGIASMREVSVWGDPPSVRGGRTSLLQDVPKEQAPRAVARPGATDPPSQRRPWIVGAVGLLFAVGLIVAIALALRRRSRAAL